MNTDFEWLTGGGATSAQGFLACGVAAGIKLNRNDMAMVLSDRPATAAGLFTSTRVAAAPVVVDLPFRGAGWVAGDSPNDFGIHRRTLIPVRDANGTPIVGQFHVPERFALDWVRIDPQARRANGPREATIDDDNARS